MLKIPYQGIFIKTTQCTPALIEGDPSLSAFDVAILQHSHLHLHVIRLYLLVYFNKKTNVIMLVVTPMIF
mgnify:CR=1